MAHVIEDLCTFLATAPTPWHAVQEMGNRLAIKEFIPLEMNEKWELERGKKYFIAKGGTILSFVLPKEMPKRMAIMAAHTDSPALKLKPKPLIHKANMLQLAVEVYGSPIFASWMNRDLAIAGRVVTLRHDKTLEEQLVFIDDAPLFIPLLPPHLDRKMNKQGLILNQQDHLIPIAALEDAEQGNHYLEDLLRREIAFDKLLSHELFLVPLEIPRYVGVANEMLSSYRLDNLSSCFASLIALGNLQQPSGHTIPIGFFCDHEEIGSKSNIGAESPFFVDFLDRLTQFYKLNAEETVILKEHSSCLSIDVTHALNPNYENKYDPIHRPLLGKGVAIKSNASQAYSSGIQATAELIRLAETFGLKWQHYASRSDIPSGTTVGPIFAKGLGIETVDIGIPQLSMHAAREIIAVQDFLELCALLSYYLQEER